MTDPTTRQYIGTMFWMLFGRPRHYSTFLFGLSIGVLIGIGICAPVIGWHLSSDASTVLSAFFGGVAGVAGAVVIWRLQERSQKRQIENLMLTALRNLKSVVSKALELLMQKQDDPLALCVFAEDRLYQSLVFYRQTWSGIGIHQAAFDLFTSSRLHDVKITIDKLIKHLEDLQGMFAANKMADDLDAQLVLGLCETLLLQADKAFNSIGNMSDG